MGNWPHCQECGKALVLKAGGQFDCLGCGFEWDPGSVMIEARILLDAAKEQDKRIEIVSKCLNALGQAWRGDWSGFDGRTLRSELGDVLSFFDEAIPVGVTVDSAYEAWCLTEGICPKEQCWSCHCQCEKSVGS